MQHGEKLRPAPIREVYVDDEERKKCCLCCGAVVGLYTFGIVSILSLSTSWLGTKYNGIVLKGALDRLDYYGMMPILIPSVVFTHHTIISMLLWSKNRSTIYEVNMKSIAFNSLLWFGGSLACTVFSRKYVAKKNRAYRLLLWDYQHMQRGTSFWWLPSIYGRISERLDFITVTYIHTLYHVIWYSLAQAMKEKMPTTYAMFYQDSNYSKRCSPRWREWREIQLRKELAVKEQPMRAPWGIFQEVNKG